MALQPTSAEETPHKDLLIKLMAEPFCDVTLEGNDGVRVPANRSVLAARSPTFMALFFGQFSEAKQEVVRLDFPGEILNEVVKFIHLNNTDICQQSCKALL